MNSRKNKKSVKNQKLLFEIYGVFTIAFAVLSFIGVYYNSGGIVGSVISSIIKGLVGFGAFIMPVFILLIGIGLIVKQERISFKLKFYALCFLYVSCIVFIQIYKSSGIEVQEFTGRVSASYAFGKNGVGGGAVGEIISYPVMKLFGETGSYVIAMTFIIINLLIVTNASIYKMALFIKNKVIGICKKLYSGVASINFKIDKSSEISLDAYETKKDDKIDKKRYIEEVNKKIKILDFFKTSELGGVAAEGNPNCGTMIDEVVKYQQPVKDEQREIHKIEERTKEEKLKDEKIKDEIDTHVKQKVEKYVYPPLNLLNSPANIKNTNDKKDLISNAKLLEETLESFGVEAKVVQVSRGPVITRYELQPSPGVKVSKIVNLSDDIALNLAAPAVRIEAPIPGKAAVGIEIPNKESSPVYLKEVIESKEFSEQSSPITFCLGKDVAGNSVTADLAKMPHLLIAGATGSGKSVCVNSLIISMLYKSSPDMVRLLMIDPKVVELSTYNGIPHLLIPVVTDSRKAAGALGWAVQEMTNRYKLFADNNVRNIESYNDLISKKSPEAVLPKIVIIIDELADLMMVAANDVEDCICRLAQMARAAGMHLVVATQRPSVDVLTGVIKANIPSRISFAVSSQIDSRTILDMAGAEKLLGKGDMLYYPVGESKPLRLQGAFVSEKEVEQVVSYAKQQAGIEYREEILNEFESTNESSGEVDDLLPEAIRVVIETGQASVSLLQRRLRVGYNRAARLIDSMEQRGVVGGYEGSKPRQVLISKEEYENMF